MVSGREGTQMRYEKGHKDTTRQRIIDTASGQFRENGVAAVGIAGIMSGAGLTNGAFYAHFKSKEDLVETVLTNALRRREERLRTASEANEGLEAVIREYLAPRHRDRPSGGCPTAALVAEVARHPKATRDVFTEKVRRTSVVVARSRSTARWSVRCRLRVPSTTGSSPMKSWRAASARRSCLPARKRPARPDLRPAFCSAG
jgi:AcrR family transcriptional regulator